MKFLFSSAGFRAAKSLFVVSWLLLAWTAPAGQMKLDSLAVGSQVYRNVTILSYNTTDVYFTYEAGLTCVKLKYLEPEIQKRFDYDPAAAALAEKQQAADHLRYRESVISNMTAQAHQAALVARRARMTSEDSLADPVSENSLIGKPAPAIKGDKWLGERPALEGKLVLVAFWAPWSIPCRNYIPTLDRLQRKFAGKLVVVGVTSESEAEVAAMTQPRMDFVTVLDPKAQLGAAVGVTSVPCVMLVDPKGVVRYQGHPGAITEKLVESLLAKAEE